MAPRWDGDERGRGIADAAALADRVAELAAQMRDDGWVTEDPREHMAHHLTRACERPASAVALLWIEEEDGSLHVTVRLAEPGTYQDVRGAAMGLIGHVLEGSTFVRERRSGDAFEFDVATGMMPGEGGFTGHGHVLRITVQEPAGEG